MTESLKNRIWGCATSSRAVERLSGYPYFFANSDHCLVVASEQPQGTVEMTEEYIERFGEDDWQWLEAVIADIWKKQEEEHSDLAVKKEKAEEAFLKRFRESLLEWRETNGRGTTENK